MNIGAMKFLDSNLSVASEDFQRRVKAVTNQAISLRGSTDSMHRHTVALCLVSIPTTFLDRTTGFALLAVAMVVFLCSQLMEIRYEQVYSQIQGECAGYHLRATSILAFAVFLDSLGDDVEFPKIFTSVDELLKDIFEEDGET